MNARVAASSSAGALLEDCAACAADQVIAAAGGPAWDADGGGQVRAGRREGFGV